MDLGVWMSRGVLTHKRDASEHATQAWNMKALPDEFSHSPEPHRLFVAVDGKWRGFFVLEPWVQHNHQDAASPWTLVFDANTWPTSGLNRPRRATVSAATPSMLQSLPPHRSGATKYMVIYHPLLTILSNEI